MTTSAKTLTVLAESKMEGVKKTTIFRVDPDLVQFEEGFNLKSALETALL